MTTTTTSQFRVYAACLAAYNNGLLHGRWLDVTGDVDALRADIAAMLADSPEPNAEEWAIHDYDGFNSSQWGENPDLEELCDHVQTLAKSEYDYDLIEGVCDNFSIDAREAIAYIEDNYQGKYPSLAHWAESFLEDTGSINLPQNLACYFDYASYGHDQEMEGTIFTVTANNAVHVLWS